MLSSVLHAVVGANVFFIATFVHGYNMSSVLCHPSAPAALRLSWSRTFKVAALAVALLGGVVGGALQVGTVIRAPDGAGVTWAEEAALEQSGFGQRWTVAWLIAYWASFSLDAHNLGL
jgi:hypothetical protein